MTTAYKINVNDGCTVISNDWRNDYRDALLTLDATLNTLFQLKIKFDAWEIVKVTNDGSDNVTYTTMANWTR